MIETSNPPPVATFRLKPTLAGKEGHWIGDVELGVGSETIAIAGTYVDRALAIRAARRNIWFGLGLMAVVLVLVVGVMSVAVLADIHLTLLGKVIGIFVVVGLGGALAERVAKKVGPEFEQKHGRALRLSVPRMAVTDVRRRYGRNVQLSGPVDPEVPALTKRLVLRAETTEQATALVQALTAPPAPVAPAPPHSETKVCPDCAEDVDAAAAVCEYCGHRFETAGVFAGMEA